MAQTYPRLVCLTNSKTDGSAVKLSGSGCLIIGDKGQMYAKGDYAQDGIEIRGSIEAMDDVDYPESKGSGGMEIRHVREWFDAMRDSKKRTTANFPNYGGPLTETILLGNLAVYKGGKSRLGREEFESYKRPRTRRKTCRSNLPRWLQPLGTLQRKSRSNRRLSPWWNSKPIENS